MVKFDKEMALWLRDEGREENDAALVTTCESALAGDLRSQATCEELIRHRVGKAHEHHRSLGHS